MTDLSGQLTSISIAISGLVAVRLIAFIFALIFESSAATTAIDAGFRDSDIMTTCRFGDISAKSCLGAKSIAISSSISFSSDSKSLATASA